MTADDASRAETVVREFLAALAERDRARAERYLADDVIMIFPGDVRYRSLEDMLQDSVRRYRRVGKRFERFDTSAAPARDGVATAVVYCYGTLHGVWPNGDAFDDVRFIDRFLLRNDRIVEQRVWNDSEFFRPRGAD